MLTILMCSKVLGNANSNLLNTLNSLNESVSNPARINVLIKFDDSDIGAKLLAEEIQQRNYKIKVQWIFTPRAGGYNDLHRGYNDLLIIAPPETKLYWVIADDVTLTEKHWDEVIFTAYDQAVKTFGENRLFVLHQNDNAFGHAFTYEEALERPESWPIWTREWIENNGGVGLSTFTDAWTGCIESVLINQYHYDPRVILPKKVVFRAMSAEDSPGSDKYDVVRKLNHEKLRSQTVRKMIDALALSIFLKSDLAKKQAALATNHQVMSQLYEMNGLENHLRIMLSALLEDKNTLKEKASLLAQIYKRSVFPSFQRCGSVEWLDCVAQLISEVYDEVAASTNHEYAKAYFLNLLASKTRLTA